MNPKQLWHAALGDLQLQVSPANFETWFRNTKAVAQDGDTIVIGAPTTFAKEWLEQRFHREIETTLSRLVGQNVTARIVVQQRGQSASARSFAPGATGSAVGLADPPEDRELISPTPAGLPGRSKPLGVPDQPHLNPRYTFGDFIVGQSNRLAHAASLAVADNPARAYNPLFIYGGVGLGKTHLLHAIGHTVIGRGLRVTYVSSEKFTNDLINSIRERRTEEFRAHYRTSDILLIDDIQF
ncbi:MAG: ATP-binding protein, partial [Chloroflexi bacterium]|nr:ATP-binding protein [Chloroflexota bacterium]